MLANQVGLSSKVVSERHHYASQVKMTAGQAAAKLRKLGYQIKARELVKGWELLTGREPEWHHSGFYKGSQKKTMGRTFFFSDEQFATIQERITEIQDLLKKQEAEKKVKAETIIRGFFYEWDFDYSGRYGKKRNYKVLRTYEGSALNTPRNFTRVDDPKVFENVTFAEGRRYYGWDEPSIHEFS